jgi:hypothetical protein
MTTEFPPAEGRPPKPAPRQIDEKRVMYAVAGVCELAGLVLVALFFSWKLALAALLISIALASFMFALLAEVSDTIAAARGIKPRG